LIESLGVVSIALASFIPPNFAYCSFKLVFRILVSKSVLYFFLRYFSIIKLAIGPAMVAPKPPFSTKMAMVFDYP
jgi:hypothetical protein